MDLRLPVYAKLAKAVPRQLAAIATARAGALYGRWLKSHDSAVLASMEQSIDRVGEEGRSSEAYVLLKAAWLFITTRQVSEALRVLGAHPHGESPAWVLSTAFLRAYGGNVRGAIRLYRSLRRSDTPVQTSTEVEEFLYWLEAEEPENCLVNLCLGCFNWYVKGDSDLARAEFGSFLRKRPHDRYVREAEGFARILSSPD